MTRCIYNSKRLIPAPLVSIDKNFNRVNTTKIGSVFTLTITGKILPYKGSPNKNGVFWDQGGYPPDDTVLTDSRLAAIFRKQEAIRKLFSVDGYSLEFQSADGSAPIKCNPRINKITFPEAIWHDVCDYTIELECDVLYINGIAVGEDEFSEYISEAGESWQIETDERAEGIGLPNTFRLTHTVNATGKDFYNESGDLVKPSWQQARDFVLPKLGIDMAILNSSGVPVQQNYFNHVRGENLDKYTGSYSVTETWLLASGSALEEFTVNTIKSADNGLTDVSIEGNIAGLEERSPDLSIITSKYDNAVNKWVEVSGLLLTRAQSYSGLNLNIIPQNYTIGKNPVTGTINYNYTFNNRKSNCVNGALSENITVTNSWDVDVFAAIPVLGRTAGPVLQAINTKQARTRGLNIELIMENTESTGCGAANWTYLLIESNPRFVATSNIQAIVDGVNPASLGASKTFVSKQDESWNPRTGQYNYNVEWTYE